MRGPDDCWVNDKVRGVVAHPTQQVGDALTDIGLRVVQPGEQLGDYAWGGGGGGLAALTL